MIRDFSHYPLIQWVAPVLVAIAWISITGLISEPNRLKFNAILLAGAGAAYLGGGFGFLEMPFNWVMTYVAFRGLSSYKWIGVGWILHTGWDVTHHLYGNPILPFSESSSFGCALCDPILAVWFFLGAPSIFRFPNEMGLKLKQGADY